jgi:hypothetical protein
MARSRYVVVTQRADSRELVSVAGPWVRPTAEKVLQALELADRDARVAAGVSSAGAACIATVVPVIPLRVLRVQGLSL